MANRYWVGGTGTWNTTSTTNWSATSGGAGGASVPTTADAVIFNSASSAGNYTVTIGANVNCLTFNAAGPASGTATITMSGAFTLTVAGATFDVAATGVAFGGTTGIITCSTTTSLTITTNNISIPWALNFANAGSTPKTINFGSAFDNSGFSGTVFGLSCANASGNFTLNFNGYNVTTSSYRNQSGSTATLNFGSTGALYCTGLATNPVSATCSIGNPNASTSITGSKNIYLTRSAAKPLLTFDFTSPSTCTKANSFNFIIINNGTSNTSNLVCDNFDSSLATGISQFAINSNQSTFPSKIFGNVDLGAYNLQFANMAFLNSGTQTISSSGGKLFFTSSTSTLGITFGASTTLQLQSAISIGGAAAKTVFHTQGTVDLNGYTLTVESPITAQSTGTTSRTIAFGTNGSLVFSAATSPFTASGSSLSTTGTGTISLTSGSAKTFAGGGFSYPTINQGGTGALTITGSNTFSNITNTTQPATVTLEFGSTNTFSNFSLSGTSGNLITLNSTSVSSQATVSKSSGTVDAYFMSIQDSSATGGATWNAYSSTDAGNNTGWNFPVGATGNFFMVM